MPNKKILAVDDDDKILKVIKLSLSDQYDVTTALGGQAALDLIAQKSGKFDLIITDLSMPDVNGALLYLKIMNQFPGLQERIIFMTGGSFGGYVEEMIVSYKNPFLQKPFSNDDLITAIDQTLERLK